MRCRARAPALLTGLSLLALALLTACTSVQVRQHPKMSTVRVGDRSMVVRYLLYIPEGYARAPQGEWPLILYLHGRGECGSTLELLKKHPLPRDLERLADFPAIVVSPQLQNPSNGWEPQLDALNELLLRIQATYRVDPARISVTGLSMGGSGTWHMALRFPGRFAAIVPVASYYSWGSAEVASNICDLRDLPIWAFHGARDRIVPLHQGRAIVDALVACGSAVTFTVYEDADHEPTWLRAYGDPGLYEWLLAQRLK